MFSRYLKEDLTTEDPIQWWISRKSSYPTLWKMAIDLLGIPATSTPSERIFSKAGEIYSSRRKRLLGKTAKALLHIGSWWRSQGFPGANPPILNHPHITYLRRKYPNLPLVVKSEAEGWKFKEKKDKDGKIINMELEINEALEDAAINEDDLPDNWEDLDELPEDEFIDEENLDELPEDAVIDEEDLDELQNDAVIDDLDELPEDAVINEDDLPDNWEDMDEF